MDNANPAVILSHWSHGPVKGSWDSTDDVRALADIHAAYTQGKLQEERAQRELTAVTVTGGKGPATPTQGAKNPYKNLSNQESGQEEDETRIVYPFEEFHREFYDAMEDSSPAKMPRIADKWEVHIRRCWQEVFGALRIVTAFAGIFVVELMKFVVRDTAYKIGMKIITILGDFLLKPLFSSVFNYLVQPVFIFVNNILISWRQMIAPVLEVSYVILEKVGQLLKAFRLFEVNLQQKSEAKDALPPPNGVKALEAKMGEKFEGGNPPCVA